MDAYGEIMYRKNFTFILLIIVVACPVQAINNLTEMTTARSRINSAMESMEMVNGTEV